MTLGAEWSKSDRRGEISWYPFYVESKKEWYKWTYLQTRNTGLENELLVAGGEELEGMDSYGVWDRHVHTAIFQMDNQQGPTV